MFAPTPMDRERLAEWMESEIPALDAERLAIWERIRVSPYAVPIERPTGIEQAFVVAELPDGRLVFFDDWEDGFSLSRPDPDGVLRNLVLGQYELLHITTWLLDGEAQ